MNNLDDAKKKFFKYIHVKDKGSSNLLTPYNCQYYLANGYPVEYSVGNLGKIPLYGITVIYKGSLVNEFSCCFTKEWKAKTYLQCLIDGGIDKTVKNKNVAITLKNHLLN